LVCCKRFWVRAILLHWSVHVAIPRPKKHVWTSMCFIVDVGDPLREETSSAPRLSQSLCGVMDRLERERLKRNSVLSPTQKLLVATMDGSKMEICINNPY
jgi:hypothetical protein